MDREADVPKRQPKRQLQLDRLGVPHVPDGWFKVALSRELAAGAVVAKRRMGLDLVVFRTASGQVGVFEDVCPHMGTRLSLGGRVDGDCLVCPLHKLRFDGEGRCRPAGRDDDDASAIQANRFPVAEQNGAVLAYFDRAGAQPTWTVPPLDARGWTDFRFRAIRLRTHPIIVAQDLVDLRHFDDVHGFAGTQVSRPPTVDGPRFHMSYTFKRMSAFFGGARRALDVILDVDDHGLGYSLSTISVPELELEHRVLILVTPTDGDEVELTYASSMKWIRDRSRFPPLARLLPARLLTRIVERTSFVAGFNDTMRDVEQAWKKKTLLLRPQLLASERADMATFTGWALQFFGPAEPDDRRDRPVLGQLPMARR
jgi:nitrite reductase/ring-hydroxylating ferredoxin subunit